MKEGSRGSFEREKRKVKREKGAEKRAGGKRAGKRIASIYMELLLQPFPA
jgi:hypothetical protein